MLKLLIELASIGPAVAAAVMETINAVEQATDTETRLKAALQGLETIADAVRKAL